MGNASSKQVRKLNKDLSSVPKQVLKNKTTPTASNPINIPKSQPATTAKDQKSTETDILEEKEKPKVYTSRPVEEGFDYSDNGTNSSDPRNDHVTFSMGPGEVSKGRNKFLERVRQMSAEIKVEENAGTNGSNKFVPRPNRASQEVPEREDARSRKVY
ncbi:unnamed protein product [Ambrosiozyma monospora]|uniref:Unnamed protein product n=1 Tax=Ambrosiozyma monospora TaxID=43982 RepID=A0ACB5TN60_AMBMO|nr:unnamed protein product [Ambrosiozyma monospora]